MAITTSNDKLAVMEMDDYWSPGLPLAPGAFSQGDRQQLLWGYPSVLWGAGGEIVESFCSAMTGMSGMSGGGDIL
jgi:hypothetical protein